MRILIVDDEPGIAEVASLVCQTAGHSPRVVHNGKEALRVLSREPFDLLLVDANMPHMDGPSLIRALRAEASTRDLPIIGITAQREREDQSALKLAGADCLVTKPFALAELRAAIAAVDAARGPAS